MSNMNRNQIEQYANNLEIRKKAMSSLSAAGLPQPQKSEDSLEGRNLFTEWDAMKKRFGGVSNIPFKELGDFLDRWTGMVAYARWCEAVADMDRTTATEVMATVKDQLYTLQDGNRELRAAMVSTEPIFLEWQDKYLESSAKYTTIRGLREGYEARLNSISREITRRGSDVLDNRRGMNRGNGI
ncbi:hypothetical protein [Paenibacillus xylanexedens]|uniref:hypothetical protein n=1 Tax=Paenibacillus xylanexedens TaxID=528191 RepID=UPI0011A0F75E|nr:hypothetical protein [Paenibacillus xylanexedens]